jgi:hypothetical protein
MASKNGTILTVPKSARRPLLFGPRPQFLSSHPELSNIRRTFYGKPRPVQYMAILSGPGFQTFIREKLYEFFYPSGVVLGTIRRDPVFLRAPPLQASKTQPVF